MSTLAQALAQAIELHKRGDLARAEPIYRQILASDPNHAKTLNLLGLLTLQAGRVNEALPLLERSVALEPSLPDFLGNLGAAYRIAKRPADALAAYDRALALQPQNPGLLYNRGLALSDLGRPHEAHESYRRGLALDGSNAQLLNNLGDVERQLGLNDEALAHLDRALAIDPNYGNAHYNRSLVLLKLGRLREGFAENEARLRLGEFNPRSFPQPTWDGSPLGDKTLLIYTEQGLGDAIQFVRYLPLVAKCGAVYLEVQPPLIPLLDKSPLRGLVPQGASLPHFDVQVSLASLPAVFGTTLETIPAAVPYLTIDEPRLARWRSELARYDGLKVGILWQGNPTFREDRFRSIPLAKYAPLAAVPGVQLFSLQKGPGSKQVSQFANAFRLVDLGCRADNDSQTFADTAAIMKNLDLVITSDTACAHLAGALDVPVWIALAQSSDWRWLTARSDSPWYPAARLFRQPAHGDWASVFQTIAARLRQMAGAG